MVTLEMLAIALGRTIPLPESPEGQQWFMWVRDAEMLIAARLDLGEIDPARLEYVVREAVVAHIRKPDDATQVAVSVDDGSVSRTYRSSKGRVVIVDEWWALLAPNKARRAFRIDTVEAVSRHRPWCSLAFGASCSCGTDLAGHPIFEAVGE